MKKKVVLFLTILAMTACLFALSVSADSIYSDFTKPGVNGENPIFTCVGYSTYEAGGSVCIGYNVDLDALEAYEEIMGTTLKYGIVVASKDNVDGGKPLDSNGLATGANKDKIMVIDLGERTDRISVSIVGLSEESFEKHLIMSLYVHSEQDGVKYVGDETSAEGPQSITFSDALQGKPATPAVPPVIEVTIGNITYSINGTTAPAADRIKQKNASDADYKSGSSLNTLRLLYASLAANGIAGLGGSSSINMPAAADFMKHYVGNTGKDYNLDVAAFLSQDSGALSSRNKAINNALRAAEQLAQRGKSVTVNQLTEGHPMQNSLATQNWQYSLGSYFDDVDIINLTVTEVNGVKTYTADIKYIVTDFYNWDTNDYNEFKGIISPHDLHELHKAGKAREFLTYGEITYSGITWTEGQDVSVIAGLN